MRESLGPLMPQSRSLVARVQHKLLLPYLHNGSLQLLWAW